MGSTYNMDEKIILENGIKFGRYILVDGIVKFPAFAQRFYEEIAESNKEAAERSKPYLKRIYLMLAADETIPEYVASQMDDVQTVRAYDLNLLDDKLQEAEKNARKTRFLLNQYEQGHSGSQSYCLGEPVTHFHPFNGYDGSRIEFNTDSFDMLIGLTNATEEEAESIFRDIILKLFVSDNWPFLLFGTSKFTFDFNFNIMKVNEAFRKDWIKGTEDVVKIILVRAEDMTLLGLRSIRLPLIKQIRVSLKGQLSYTVQQNDSIIQRAMNMLSIQDMVRMAQYECSLPPESEDDAISRMFE